MSVRFTVFTSIYPSAEPYLGQMLTSLRDEARQPDALLVINDGVANGAALVASLLRGAGSPPPFPVHVMPAAGGSAAAVRRAGLAHLPRGWNDWVVFLDADDIAAPGRLAALEASAARPEIADTAVLFHDLHLFGPAYPVPQSMFGGTFANGTILTAADIVEGNALGLSNTAMRGACLDAVIDDLPDAVTAFDWAMFSLVLLRCGPARYVSDALSLYRRHDASIGHLAALDDVAIRAVCRTKAQHYAFLARFDADFQARAARWQRIVMWLDEVSRSSTLLADLRRRAAASGTRPLWWQALTDEGLELP